MNPFRQLIRASGSTAPLGTWVMSASPIVAEAIGHAGFHWGVLDMEHTPLDMMEVIHLLQAVGNTKMVPVLRVPWNDSVTVKRVLDAGAQTLMFPFVQNPDEAARAVASTRYPPEGMRGLAGMSRGSKFGTIADYPKVANKSMGVIVQLETTQAIAQLEKIAEVPGVDAIFLGPGDLSATWPPELVVQYRAMGYDYVAIASDLGLLMRGAQAAVKSLTTTEREAQVHTLSGGTQTGGTY
jgi:2-keto-3-deoxy-L-rhamnonate aldolase RhmA